MTGVVIALCATVLMSTTGPVWRRRRAKRTLGGHTETLDRLARAVPPGGSQDPPPAGDQPGGSWFPPAPPPPPPPDVQLSGPAQPVDPSPTGEFELSPVEHAPPGPADQPAEAPAGGVGIGRLVSGAWRPVGALAGLVGLAVVALVATTLAGGGGGHRYHPAVSARPAPTTAPAATTTVAPPTTSAPPTTAPPPPAAPGAPVLASVTPASAAPGQPVTLSGSNFYSPSGHITVSFGSTTAGVSCSSSTTCTATVPPNGGSGPATTVTISTDAGTSRPVPFSYP